MGRKQLEGFGGLKEKPGWGHHDKRAIIHCYRPNSEYTKTPDDL